ncbi:MAG: AAA family ATPase [Synergistaceae bacterium]|nr:AAA family ATPase [Synergistaceae bacterium]
MMIVGFCNLKGGVGKTTACQNIAAALSKMGRKVAVIDMDPQSNLSAGFGLNPSPTDPQVFDLLSGAVEWDDVITTKEGIDIVPSSLSLVMAELNEDGPMQKQTALRDAIAKIDADRYDYILLDSPPQLGIFTQNVLAACDKIIVPMDGGFYSLFGLRLLDRSMGIFRERINPELEIGGILMTNYNPRLYISRKIYEDVKKAFGELLFETYIRQNVSIVEASSVGMSVLEYEAKSKGADGYRAVAEEFVKRFEGGYVPSVPVHAPADEPEAEPVKDEHDEPEAPAVKEPEVPAEPEPEPEREPEISAEPEAESESVHEPEREEITEPESEPVSEPEPESAPVNEPEEEQKTESEPEQKPSLPSPVKLQPGEKRVTLGAYEESIKQDVIDMLPDSEKGMWIQLLDSVTDISRGEVDVRSLREDFEDSDKDRYTFYVLNDESDSFWPVMYPDQIIEPLRCVIKWDEEGSAEVYM